MSKCTLDTPLVIRSLLKTLPPQGDKTSVSSVLESLGMFFGDDELVPRLTGALEILHQRASDTNKPKRQP